MVYNTDLWDSYTEENKEKSQKELSKFIYHMSLGLNAKTILEGGCNIGNNLLGFPSNVNVTGIDLNEKAIEMAKSKFSTFNFKVGSLLKIPFPDSSFDIVFTRGVLIHIPNESMAQVVKELHRVSKKWIFNLEYFGEDSKMISWKRGDDLLWYRDMKVWWKNFDVEIISETDIPEELDFGKTRFTLVQKK
jgi:hypothetical protein